MGGWGESCWGVEYIQLIIFSLILVKKPRFHITIWMVLTISRLDFKKFFYFITFFLWAITFHCKELSKTDGQTQQIWILLLSPYFTELLKIGKLNKSINSASITHTHIYIYIYIYIYGVPKKCIHIRNNCKRSIFFTHLK